MAGFATISNVTTPGPQDTPSAPAWARSCAAGLLVTFAALSLWGAWVKSDTYDEPMYILSGYSYVATGDFSLNREHPPLAKLLMGLPLLALDVVLPDDYQTRTGIAMAFLFHQPHADPHVMLFLARLGGVVMGLVLGAYVLRWATVAWGWKAGLVALALFVSNPNILAHSRVAATDFAGTVWIFACLYHVWRWLQTDKPASLAWMGVTLGLALGSKFTALPLLPVIAVMVVVRALSRRRPILLVQGLLGGCAALGILWILYLGEARSLAEAQEHVRFSTRDEASDVVFGTAGMQETLESLFGEDGKIPLLTFLKGIDLQMAHAAAGHPTYFRGEVAKGGFSDFYLVTWLVKNPEALTLLLLLGWWGWRRSWKGWIHETALYGLPLLLFLIFSQAQVQLGFKYLLPVVPFLCVSASRAFADRNARDVPSSDARRGALLVTVVSLACILWFSPERTESWRVLFPLLLPIAYGMAVWRLGPGLVNLHRPLSALLLWCLVASIVRQPHNLNYFNEWCGGPSDGWKISVIGDDWGQDTAALGRWMKDNDVDHIAYDYYGTGDAEAWGVRYTPTFGHEKTFDPIEGWVAVHTAWYARLPQNYRWLDGVDPVGSINDTILLWNLSPGDRVEALLDVMTSEQSEEGEASFRVR